MRCLDARQVHTGGASRLNTRLRSTSAGSPVYRTVAATDLLIAEATDVVGGNPIDRQTVHNSVKQSSKALDLGVGQRVDQPVSGRKPGIPRPIRGLLAGLCQLDTDEAAICPWVASDEALILQSVNDTDGGRVSQPKSLAELINRHPWILAQRSQRRGTWDTVSDGLGRRLGRRHRGHYTEGGE